MKIFTASDVAKFCRVSTVTVWRWAKKGEFSYFLTVGKHLRIPAESMHKFLEERGCEIPQEVLEAVSNEKEQT